MIETLKCFSNSDMSFVWVTPSKIYIYRDVFGKRSLIIHYSETEVCIASVVVDSKSNYFEVPSNCLITLDATNLSIVRNLSGKSPSCERFRTPDDLVGLPLLTED
jgi:asparagine synthetase B (glutamine-hydrolysing)